MRLFFLLSVTALVGCASAPKRWTDVELSAAYAQGQKDEASVFFRILMQKKPDLTWEQQIHLDLEKLKP